MLEVITITPPFKQCVCVIQKDARFQKEKHLSTIRQGLIGLQQTNTLQTETKIYSMYHTIKAYHDSSRISEILVVQNHNYTLSEFSCTAHAQMEIMETQPHFPYKISYSSPKFCVHIMHAMFHLRSAHHVICLQFSPSMHIGHTSQAAPQPPTNMQNMRLTSRGILHRTSKKWWHPIIIFRATFTEPNKANLVLKTKLN